MGTPVNLNVGNRVGNFVADALAPMASVVRLDSLGTGAASS